MNFSPSNRKETTKTPLFFDFTKQKKLPKFSKKTKIFLSLIIICSLIFGYPIYYLYQEYSYAKSLKNNISSLDVMQNSQTNPFEDLQANINDLSSNSQTLNNQCKKNNEQKYIIEQYNKAIDDYNNFFNQNKQSIILQEYIKNQYDILTSTLEPQNILLTDTNLNDLASIENTLDQKQKLAKDIENVLNTLKANQKKIDKNNKSKLNGQEREIYNEFENLLSQYINNSGLDFQTNLKILTTYQEINSITQEIKDQGAEEQPQFFIDNGENIKQYSENLNNLAASQTLESVTVLCYNLALKLGWIYIEVGESAQSQEQSNLAQLLEEANKIENDITIKNKEAINQYNQNFNNLQNISEDAQNQLLTQAQKEEYELLEAQLLDTKNKLEEIYTGMKEKSIIGFMM